MMQYKLAPIESTDEMIFQASYEMSFYCLNITIEARESMARKVYKAMLEAAPSQPAQEPDAWEIESPAKTWSFVTTNKEELQAQLDIGWTIVNKLFTTPPSEAARIQELEANELAYEQIIGHKSYQEVADEIRLLEAKLAELVKFQSSADRLAEAHANLLTEYDKCKQDSERLDYIQAQGEGCGFGWVARQSFVERGFRVHQDPSNVNGRNVRAAIDEYRAKKGS